MPSLQPKKWVSRYGKVHENPQGPGDARPTGREIVEDEVMEGRLLGKVILITGASSGIGVETARALYKTGAHVFLGVRDTVRGYQIAEEVKNGSSDRGVIDVIELDLASLDSVRSAAMAFLSKNMQLNILINNAGIMACPESKTEDGYESQFGVNHLGHFLLFQLLKPVLIESATPGFNSRVINVSSVGHRRSPIMFEDVNFEKEPYDAWLAYGQSKTANILMANEIERRYGAEGLHAFSLHPGAINTPLSRYIGEEGYKALVCVPGMLDLMKSPEQGAATTVWAAIGREWEGKGGKYLEHLQPAGPVDPKAKDPTNIALCGYSAWAFDEDAARELWDLSNNMVGFVEI